LLPLFFFHEGNALLDGAGVLVCVVFLRGLGWVWCLCRGEASGENGCECGAEEEGFDDFA